MHYNKKDLKITIDKVKFVKLKLSHDPRFIKLKKPYSKTIVTTICLSSLFSKLALFNR